MSSSVYVSNLCYSMDANDIKATFEKHGLSVEKVKLFTRFGGSSQGKCCIEFKTQQDASKAISILDGSFVRGRMIHVKSYEWYLCRFRFGIHFIENSFY